MPTGKTLDQILAELNQEAEEKTAEEKMAEGLSEETEASEDIESKEEATKETPEETKEAEEVKEVKEVKEVEEESEEVKEAEVDEEVEKVAAEIDAHGRILARAFVDEIQKIAVGVGPMTGNSADASQAKSVNHLPVSADLSEAGKVETVIAKIKSLTAATEASQPSIEIDTNSQAAPKKAPDESAGTIAADAALAVGHKAALPLSSAGQEMGKAAADNVVDAVYNYFFEDKE